MICKNEIVELNNKRPCWFPINPSSPFGLCSRCDFYKVESCLKEIQSNLHLLSNEPFQTHCQDSIHWNSLLQALTQLQQTNPIRFQTFFTSLTSRAFLQELNHQVHTHSPSSRCKLYQHILKNRHWDCEIKSTDMPWNCWDCLSFILKQKNMLGCYRAFSNGIVTNRIKKPESSPDNVVDCMVSLHLFRKDHTARLLFERLRRSNLSESTTKKVLLDFLTKPATVNLLFTSAASEFIPESWKKELTPSFLQRAAMEAVKRRNYIFKEELIIKTWHPNRLFPWCLDIEELKDFGF